MPLLTNRCSQIVAAQTSAMKEIVAAASDYANMVYHNNYNMIK